MSATYASRPIRPPSRPRTAVTSSRTKSTSTRRMSSAGVSTTRTLSIKTTRSMSTADGSAKYKQEVKKLESKPIEHMYDNYQSISKLGRGGFAMVYLMRKKEDGLFYAAKHQTFNEEEKWDGMREACLLFKLQECKFVIRMVEFYQSKDESVIVTEYLEGCDLFASLSEPGFELTEAKCRVIISQVLDALVYIHKLRVVHMDIKPNNILLASKDRNNLKIK